MFGLMPRLSLVLFLVFKGEKTVRGLLFLVEFINMGVRVQLQLIGPLPMKMG